MKIKKKNGQFVAYCDSNDNLKNSKIQIGDSLGSISISTGKFIGNTVCLNKLSEHREEYLQKLVDEVIEELKSDFANGDYTVIDELLKHLPVNILIGSLQEEKWKRFK